MCQICYHAPALTDVSLGGKGSKGVTIVSNSGIHVTKSHTYSTISSYLKIQDSSCCDYGIKGTGLVGGGDCIKIPGAEKKTSTANKGIAACQAGGQKGLVTVSGTAQATVCCKYFLLFDNQLAYKTAMPLIKVTSMLIFLPQSSFLHCWMILVLNIISLNVRHI